MRKGIACGGISVEDQRVEPEDGCANAERLGPYESEQAARQALERAAELQRCLDDG